MLDLRSAGTALREIFMPDYGPRLEAAKQRLCADLYGADEEPTSPAEGS
ncbi:hypothetical protein ACIP10_07890 [Streptomyces galbus]